MSESTENYDPVLEASAVKKVATRVFPLLVLGLFISFIDRTNMGVLKAPLQKDLGMTPAEFATASGLFFIGYLLFEIPSNMAMAKFGARFWLARIMLTWGAVTMVTGLVNTPLALNIMRVLLGIAEAGFFPGVLLYLTLWFPQRSLGKANAIFELGVPISLAFASTITSLVLMFANGALGLAGWRWAFLLEGAPAVLLGIVFLVVLPNGPLHGEIPHPAGADVSGRTDPRQGSRGDDPARWLCQLHTAPG